MEFSLPQVHSPHVRDGAIRVNIPASRLPPREGNGVASLKIPLNAL